MAFRELSVTEVREVLRAWLSGTGLRKVAAQAGVDRKTARRYVEAAAEAGLARDGEVAQLSDELLGQVAESIRPGGHGGAWVALEARHGQIGRWLTDGLPVVKIGTLLERQGVVVPYRTLHRFCAERCGFGRSAATVRSAGAQPGAQCQLDFGYMGMVADPAAGRRRRAYALIFTAVYSRHMFVWLSPTQTLAGLIAGCEAAWGFFGGVFKVIVPVEAQAIVADAGAVNPRFTVGWLDYAQHRGFATDVTRVRSAHGEPGAEPAVQYVRANFFARENFASLTQAQARAQAWCRDVAGMRIHAATAARPREVFAEHEAAALLPAPEVPYDVPVFAKVKVHRDLHIEVGKALYSVPRDYPGARLEARADSALVKLFHRGQLVKTHPRQAPGGRSTDAADLPAEQTAYAMRDVASLVRAACRHGENAGVYAERLLGTDLPWTKMRQVNRLLGLARRYGSRPADTACQRALELDVISVEKIASMLAKAAGNTPLPPPRRPPRPRRGSPATQPDPAPGLVCEKWGAHPC